MKKMLLATARPYYRMCSTDVYCSKNKPAAVATSARNHHPSFLRFWNWAEETVDAAKWQKMLERNRNQQTFVNGLLGFITLGIYTPLEARVYCFIDMSCPSMLGNSICTAH